MNMKWLMTFVVSSCALIGFAQNLKIVESKCPKCMGQMTKCMSCNGRGISMGGGCRRCATSGYCHKFCDKCNSTGKIFTKVEIGYKTNEVDVAIGGLKFGSKKIDFKECEFRVSEIAFEKTSKVTILFKTPYLNVFDYAELKVGDKGLYSIRMFSRKNYKEIHRVIADYYKKKINLTIPIDICYGRNQHFDEYGVYIAIHKDLLFVDIVSESHK